MLISSSKRYVINSQKAKILVESIKGLSPKCIMRNKLMTRTVFQVVGKESMWLRIRTGDVDCIGNPITSASLMEKAKSPASQRPDKKAIHLQLTDYYNDVAFFKNMGMPVVSEQETKRTKYICHYDGIKYTVCLDIWPKLEKYTFVSITPATNAEDDDLEGFIVHIGVREFNIKDFPTDVDAAYERLTGRIARKYELLRFE